MNLKHIGLSGHQLKVIDKKVVEKSTKGEVAIKILKQSIIKQINAYKSDTYKPFEVVPIMYYIEEKNSFKAYMPFLDYETGLTASKEKIKRLGNHIHLYLQKAIDLSKIKNNFKERIKSRISDLEGDATRRGLYEKVKEYYHRTLLYVDMAKGTYPSGFYHGDLGFANIFIDKENKCHLFDFSNRYIETPLIDIVTMWNSIEGVREHCVIEQKKIIASCMMNFHQYSKEILILKMVEKLCWLSFIEAEKNRERTIQYLEEDFKRFEND